MVRLRNCDRRGFLRAAAISATAGRLGTIASANTLSEIVDPKNVSITIEPQPGNYTSFAPIEQVEAGILNVGYAQAGPADGPVVLLLHGWPYDIHSYVDVAPILALSGYRVIVPFLRGHGTTRFLSSDTFRSGEQAALGADALALMDALRIEKAVVAGYDWGGRAACVVAALWPARCKALVSVTGYSIINLAANRQPAAPEAEWSIWSQFYLCTERGRLGYRANRYDLNKFLWRLASPKWHFDVATYDRTAAAFENPDHVDVVVHSYRWRLGESKGAPQYADLDRKLQCTPVIDVPTITIASDYDVMARTARTIASYSPANIRTASLLASGTTFLKKRLRLSRKRLSMPTVTEPALMARGATSTWAGRGEPSIDDRRRRLQQFEASGQLRIEYLVNRYHEFFGLPQIDRTIFLVLITEGDHGIPVGKECVYGMKAADFSETIHTLRSINLLALRRLPQLDLRAVGIDNRRELSVRC